MILMVKSDERLKKISMKIIRIKLVLKLVASEIEVEANFP